MDGPRYCAPTWSPAYWDRGRRQRPQVLYRMGGRAHAAPVEASRSGTQEVPDMSRLWTSDRWPIVRVSADEATAAASWAALCARELGVPTPEVRFYVAPPNVRSGYVSDKSPGVVFVRHGMDLSETRSTIAHEVAHLAGASEREARRYEADRRRGAWWAPSRTPAEPTAEEWAIHAAELRGRRYGLESGRR